MKKFCRTTWCQNYNKELDDTEIQLSLDGSHSLCKACFMEVELVPEPPPLSEEQRLLRPLPPTLSATPAEISIIRPPPPPPEEKITPETEIQITGALAFPVLELWYQEEKQGEREIMGDKFLIGRLSTEKDIYPDLDLSHLVERKEISRRHAQIVQDEGAYFIEDLGSKNGTYLIDPEDSTNLDQIDLQTKKLEPFKLYPLKNGSLIVIGQWIYGLRFLWSGG